MAPQAPPGFRSWRDRSRHDPTLWGLGVACPPSSAVAQIVLTELDLEDEIGIRIAVKRPT
jgi:hypothetical protein